MHSNWCPCPWETTVYLSLVSRHQPARLSVRVIHQKRSTPDVARLLGIRTGPQATRMRVKSLSSFVLVRRIWCVEHVWEKLNAYKILFKIRRQFTRLKCRRESIIKSKPAPVTGRWDPQHCQTSKLPRFLENLLRVCGEVVSLTRRSAALYPRKIPGTHFC
jgi:hypothetical protein